jgi:SAM-dependent methyltransferase
VTQLYTTFAELYHKMYQSFIDYDEEYAFYKKLIDRKGSRSVLEIGCGTGELARRFLKDGYGYTGIDISATMLNYARKELPQNHFHEMDMRDITLPREFDAVLITARSISYILINNDVMSTFRSIKNVLNAGGMLIFDFIDAKHFIPSINQGETITHEVLVDNVKYKRESIFQRRIDSNWNWIWKSTFFKQDGGTFSAIGSDEAELRAFTADELEIFLSLTGFQVTQLINRKVYAFDTQVIEASA